MPQLLYCNGFGVYEVVSEHGIIPGRFMCRLRKTRQGSGVN